MSYLKKRVEDIVLNSIPIVAIISLIAGILFFDDGPPRIIILILSILFILVGLLHKRLYRGKIFMSYNLVVGGVLLYFGIAWFDGFEEYLVFYFVAIPLLIYGVITFIFAWGNYLEVRKREPQQKL